MRSFLTILGAVTFLAAGSANASKVTNIKLDHIEGFTVTNISVDGPVRFIVLSLFTSFMRVKGFEPS